MTETVSLDELDRLLGELDDLVAVSASSENFYHSLLSRLQYVVNARSCGLIVPGTAADEWICIAQQGAESEHRLVLDQVSADRDAASIISSDKCRLVTFLKPSAKGFGALLLELETPISPQEMKPLQGICSAFAELLLRWHYRDIDKLLSDKLPQLQQLLMGLSDDRLSMKEFHTLFVNDVAVLFGSDRASISRSGALRADLLAVSGVMATQNNSATSLTIRKLSKKVLNEQATMLSKDVPTDQREHLLEYFVAFPLGVAGRAKHCILLEWQSREEFIDGLRLLGQTMPQLESAWHSTLRWLRVPYAGRVLSKRSSSSVPWSKLAKFVALILGCCFLFWLVCLPTVLKVEARGSLQPVVQRIAYASVDGTVQSVLVTDGQKVHENQPLLKMTSSRLELELQELEGKIGANVEKRDGLNVLISQASSSSSDWLAQSRIASQIKELEAEHIALKSQLAALKQEQEKLTVVAPLGGVVVAQDIESLLDARPLKRGDPLVRISQLEGPWRLELRVSDSDSQLVKRHFFNDGANAKTFEFVYASKPEERLAGEANWISSYARNPDGDGAFFDVYAAINREASLKGHTGATVFAYFECGKKPIWYVWARPMIEYIQRTWWY